MPSSPLLPLLAGVVLLLLSPSASAQWSLVWEDNFDGSYVDRSKWDYEVDCYGGGNNEKQCYVDNTANVWVRNGLLHINPIYHPSGYQGSYDNCTNNNQNSCTWTQPATSGRIRTLRSTSWTYGRFEIMAQMPKGDFLWPAIWMLPTDNVYGSWAASGEIDIQEYRGQDPRNHEHTLHFGGQWPYNTYEGSGPLDSGIHLGEGMHQYAVEWDVDEMRWYLDGQLKRTATLNRSFYSGNGPNPYWANRQPFDQRFHMILNVAVGGNFFPPDRYGHFDPAYHSKSWVQPLMIDYVRVFRRS